MYIIDIWLFFWVSWGVQRKTWRWRFVQVEQIHSGRCLCCQRHWASFSLWICSFFPFLGEETPACATQKIAFLSRDHTQRSMTRHLWLCYSKIGSHFHTCSNFLGTLPLAAISGCQWALLGPSSRTPCACSNALSQCHEPQILLNLTFRQLSEHLVDGLSSKLGAHESHCVFVEVAGLPARSSSATSSRPSKEAWCHRNTPLLAKATSG